uniref:Uncharacterized protein n=1 Tax=Solanum lycopersicum TaxID=4081 RepID=A0A3Q7IWQ4_SOLLC
MRASQFTEKISPIFISQAHMPSPPLFPDFPGSTNPSPFCFDPVLPYSAHQQRDIISSVNIEETDKEAL